MRAKSNKCYFISLVALFVLFGSQTAWSQDPTINPAEIPDPIEDTPYLTQGGEPITFTPSVTEGLKDFKIINLPEFLTSTLVTPAEIEVTNAAGRPSVNDVGSQATFTVSAEYTGTVVNKSYTVTVQERNDPPKITNKKVNDTATQNAVYEYKLELTDEEGHPLEWNEDASRNNPTNPLPEWLTVRKEEEYGRFTITSTDPISNELALSEESVTVFIQIDDKPQNLDLAPESATVQYTLQLINVNDEPTIEESNIPSNDTASEMLEDENDPNYTPYQRSFTVEDIDNDTLELETVTKPNWMSVAREGDTNTWNITGTPDNEDAYPKNNPYEVDLLIKDGNGGTTPFQYTITVQNLNDTPQIISGLIPKNKATEDQPYTHSFTVEDVDGDTVSWDEASSDYPSWLGITVEKISEDDVRPSQYLFTMSGTPLNADVLPEEGSTQKTEEVTIVFTDNAVLENPDIEEGKTGQLGPFTLELINDNDSPKVTPGSIPAVDSVNQDDLYELTFTVTDPDKNDLRVVVEDTIFPQWADPMTIDPLQGPSGQQFTLTGKPNYEDANQTEPFPVVIRIGDNVTGDEEFITIEFEVDVINTNDPPEITSEPIPDGSFATQNTLYTKKISFTDKDNNTVQWIEAESVIEPGMAAVDVGTNNFEFRWVPTNEQVTDLKDGTQVGDTYNVSLKFCDNFDQDPKCQTVLIADLGVENINDPPTIKGEIPALVAGLHTEEVPFIFTPEVNDVDKEKFGIGTFTYTMSGQDAISGWSNFDFATGQLKLWPSADQGPSADQADATFRKYDISITVSDGEKKAILPLEIVVVPEAIKKGDFNIDSNVDLTDAILVLKILAGIDLDLEEDDQAFKVQADTDPNEDGVAGLADVIYIFNQLAGR